MKVKKNWWFIALASISVILLIISLFLPPMGAISPSVLQGVAEIFAWGALGTVIKAIDNGTTATVTHNNTSVTVGKDEDFDRQEDWNEV